MKKRNAEIEACTGRFREEGTKQLRARGLQAWENYCAGRLQTSRCVSARVYDGPYSFSTKFIRGKENDKHRGRLRKHAPVTDVMMYNIVREVHGNPHTKKNHGPSHVQLGHKRTRHRRRDNQVAWLLRCAVGDVHPRDAVHYEKGEAWRFPTLLQS